MPNTVLHSNGNGGNSNEGSIHGPSWTPSLVLIHVLGIIQANDVRYKELFNAAKEAVATATVAAEKLTNQAFASAEKAIKEALAANEKSTAAAFVAAEKAVALAEANAERWRQDAQEWRSRMTEREKDFSTKTEVDGLKERLDRGEGSSGGMRSLAGWVFGGIMALTSIISIILSHK